MMASLPTPTIVRIKRHLGSESSETIIVSSKRIKIDTNDTTPDPVPEICTTILKKLTTLKQLVCSKRNLQENESDPLGFNVFDALKEKEESPLLSLPSTSTNTNSDVISCNGLPMESEKVEFVYDLYYTSLPLELSSWINNICE
ncbi:hypothetical protein Avbf_17993 [Armadillidium vulgare]|nr:hypothetical protein Avbf_17993 [Armadillidium vulgare]